MTVSVALVAAFRSHEAKRSARQAPIARKEGVEDVPDGWSVERRVAQAPLEGARDVGLVAPPQNRPSGAPGARQPAQRVAQRLELEPPPPLCRGAGDDGELEEQDRREEHELRLRRPVLREHEEAVALDEVELALVAREVPVVAHEGARLERDAMAGEAETPGEVGVLDVEEEILVEASHLLERLALVERDAAGAEGTSSTGRS